MNFTHIYVYKDNDFVLITLIPIYKWKFFTQHRTHHSLWMPNGHFNNILYMKANNK